MNYWLKNSILLMIVLISVATQAQDEILFLNGKIIKGTLLEKTNYEFTFKTEKDKEHVLDKYRIFSYTQNNKENIVYEYDTLSGNFLTVEDMKLFVYGERDAQYSFKPVFTNCVGLGIGATAGYFMHKESSFILIATPLVYTVTTLLFPTKVHKRRLQDHQYIKNDEYLRGHERIARSKRTQSALKSSVVGMGVGFIISLIANKSSN